MSQPKHPRYQDYVIKDGKLLAQFEQMYQDHEDPWHQIQEGLQSDKAMAIHWMKTLGVQKVLELGSGLGEYTNYIQKAGFDVLGVDISETAVKKAREKHPKCKFKVGNVLDLDIYHSFRPDVVIMAEITWYILDMLDEYISFMKANFAGTYLIHLLVTYPPGIQKHGREAFTSLAEIKKYFGIDYLEWGEIQKSGNDVTKTFFLGKW